MAVGGEQSDLFVLMVRYREKDLMRVGVMYAPSDRPEREVVDGLQDGRTPRAPGVAGRVQQRRATAPGVPGHAQNVGIRGLPHRLDVDVEGSGGARPQKIHD